MMVYQPFGGPYPFKLSHRPLTMFMDTVDRPELNYKGPRFTPIDGLCAQQIVMEAPGLD